MSASPPSQRAVIDLLDDPATHGAAVERVTTHISELFLVGARVYKLKRAVRFPYVDFSSLDHRRSACAAEVAINRRTAPDLYLGVAPIVRDAAGRLALGAHADQPIEPTDGAAVDWVVVMRRFDQTLLFDRMAARGALTEPLIQALTDRVAAFHRAAAPRPDGGAALGDVLAASLTELTATTLPATAVARVAARARAVLGAVAPVLDRRAAAGRVRHCHGDLHLRNVCLIDGQPTLFDTIEFDDALAVIDVLYDLAFLVMDLLHVGLPASANLAVNRYLEQCDELDGLPAFGLMLAMRALVRAKIEAVRAAETPGTARPDHDAEAARFLALAEACLAVGVPRLVALGGLSGSGKSTVARRLAPLLGGVFGAVIVRSDVARKQLAGVALETRLDGAAYGAEQAARVYDEMRRRAAQALAAGYPVVIDAVHARADERAAAAALAQRAGVPFSGLWLDVRPERLVARVAARTRDASDATAAVVRAQLDYDTGPIEWTVIDAAGELDETVAAARAALLTRTD
ncbi:MAG: AAA family ATPase [Proteobacteria bacterium]|nr:AAA family ATPase [Pseudomonadota bacterium]